MARQGAGGGSARRVPSSVSSPQAIPHAKFFRVTRGRVLVIDGDEWTANLLVRSLEAIGFTVEACGEAMAGFRAACERPPNCVVLNPELPDVDGAWVARRIRTEAEAVSRVPILFVGDANDSHTRAQMLNVGGDVFLARPVTNAEVVAQICALVGMAERFGPREQEPPSSRSLGAAIRGDLSIFPLASVLMMFEMERRSGILEAVNPSGRRASLVLSLGLFAGTEIGGAARPALTVLREVLAWRAGRFSFQPQESEFLPTPRAQIGALVLEAMRLDDEEKELRESGSLAVADDLVEVVERDPDEKVILRTLTEPPPRVRP
jgi:CheY-like chemotaxis protein